MNETLKKWAKIGGIGVLAIIVLLMFVALLAPRRTTLTKSKMMRTTDDVAGLNIAMQGSAGGRVAREKAVTPAPSLGMPNISTYGEVADVAPFQAGIESDSSSVVDKRVIKTGYLSLKVTKADDAANRIGDVARRFGGEIFSSNFSNNRRGLPIPQTQSKSGSIVVKVPADKFEETFAELKKVATEVESESTNAQDVTEEFVDIEAQLRNKRAEEAAFVKILDQSGKIDDILAVTREVARVRGEIERLEGRKRFMESQTAMSSITITLTEDVAITPVADGWRPWQVFKAAVNQLIKNLQGLADSTIVFFVVTLPALLVAVLILWILWKISKVIYRKISSKM